MKNNSAPLKVKNRKKTQGIDKQEYAKAKKLSKEILAEARKIAQIEIQKMVVTVLSEATVIARWNEKPFYIS